MRKHIDLVVTFETSSGTKSYGNIKFDGPIREGQRTIAIHPVRTRRDTFQEASIATLEPIHPTRIDQMAVVIKGEPEHVGMRVVLTKYLGFINQWSVRKCLNPGDASMGKVEPTNTFTFRPNDLILCEIVR